MNVDTEAIRAVVGPAVARLGLDVYDVRFKGSGRARILEVLLDRDGGIDLETVSSASRVVSEALDAHDVIEGAYVLEVSSPGVERPLRQPAHFLKAVGETVTVKYSVGDASRRFRGQLLDAGDAGITLDSGDGSLHIEYGNIIDARTLFDFEAGKHAKKKTHA